MTSVFVIDPPFIFQLLMLSFRALAGLVCILIANDTFDLGTHANFKVVFI